MRLSTAPLIALLHGSIEGASHVRKFAPSSGAVGIPHRISECKFTHFTVFMEPGGLILNQTRWSSTEVIAPEW